MPTVSPSLHTLAGDQFQTMREALEQGVTPEPEVFSTPSYRRLALAWADPKGSASDLAVLLRHILRRESEWQNGQAQTLMLHGHLPRFADFDHERWDAFGLQATKHGNNITLRAKAWRPDWLHIPTGAPSPEKFVFAGTPRRQWDDMPPDPFLPAVGHKSYRSAGQMAAVRALLQMPPGATLVINLPTGAGKSLCAHVLAQVPFAGASSEGVTVVVVPTTALCLDQERAVAHLISDNYKSAYISGEERAEIRSEIRRRILDGTQRIVFTSPESALGSLRSVLYTCAQRGLLRALVVDEAHIIEGWGDEFRPAFQELAGLRRGLLRECSGDEFRTLLLSATLTESTMVTLETLFGDPGPFQSVSAVQLRPEPELWLSACHDFWLPNAQDDQINRIWDALRHLPRPLILYTTRVDDAKAWAIRLREAGFRRFACMTGQSSPSERARIVDDWSNERLDVVVATSAFGLGIDQSDVRSVVHACVPETLDRLYQEIGRGGRDGRASLSLVIYTDSPYNPRRSDKTDMELGETMNVRRIISIGRGRQRWGRMFSTAQPLGNDRFRVRLDTAPGLGEGDIDMQSARNEEWNARTLTLLCRAGVIELDDEAPPPFNQIEVTATDGTTLEMLTTPSPEPGAERESLTRIVRILNHDHLSDEMWQRTVEPQRNRTEVAQKQQWALLQEVLNGSQCASLPLERAYKLSGTQPTPVARACGGCPWCRSQDREPTADFPIVSQWPWQTKTALGERLRFYTRGCSLFALFYPATWTESQVASGFSKLTPWAIEQGIGHIVGGENTLQSLRDAEASALQTAPIFFSTSTLFRQWPRVPTLLLARPGESPNNWLNWSNYEVWNGSYEPLVMMVPDTMTQIDRLDWRLCDVAQFPHARFQEWEMREAQ